MELLDVLVVDDEEGMRLAVERTLANHTFHIREAEAEIAFRVKQASCGEDALSLIEQSPPDILLLDHKLPGMTGMDLLEQLGNKASTLLTIMITAYASIETAVRATRQGAYDFLPKPFTPAELKYSLQKAAGRVVLARTARRLEEEKKRVRFEFIRVLGHELKAPLASVESNLMLLRRRTLGENLSAYSELVDRSQLRLEHMRKLITDLLDMTRIESGEKTREFSAFDAADVARRSLELVDSAAKERNISLEVKAPATLPVYADRGEFEMILNNLVSNAVKYNRDNGRVEVAMSRENSHFRLSVSDTGIGLSDAESRKLFTEFTRIKNDKTKKILGSGLGLSIVKRLAELNHGHVSVESSPNVGSTFTVVLELAQHETA